MRYVIVGLLSLIISPMLLVADTEQERLVNSAEVMDEILKIPDVPADRGENLVDRRRGSLEKQQRSQQ